MKREILKKTLIYRVLAFWLGMFITTLILFDDPWKSLEVTIWTEIGAISLYYTFEHYWRKFVEWKRLKKGMNLLSIEGNGKVSIEYNVLEVLEDNKFIIEVV